MAAFEVPIATGLFTGIPHDIATASGAVLPGQAIGNLADAYWSGQNQAYQQRLRNLFQNGVPGNLGDIATQYIQAKGAEGVPEFVNLGGLGVVQGIANKPPPDFNMPAPGQSGYTTPGPQTSTEPVEPPSSPTAGKATPRQIAQARGWPIEQVMAASGSTDPDAPLDFDQRQALVAKLQEPAQPTQVATAAGGATRALPPSVGSPTPPTPPSPPAPRQPAQPQAQPQVVAQAPAQPQVPQTQTPPQASPQAAADAQTRQLEIMAAREIYTAKVLRERAAAAAGTGQPAGVALAKSLTEDAAAAETRANDIYRNLLDRSKPTTEQQNAAASGLRPLEYEGAKAEQAKQIDHLAKLADTGVEAKGKLAQLNDVQRLGEKVGYGAIPKIQSMLGRYGIDTRGLSDIQAYERAIDFMAPQLRPIGSGRLMQNELLAFKNSLGGLMTTPEGRRLSIENLKLIQEFSAHVGGIASDTSLSPSQRYKKIYELDPPKLRIEVTKQSPGSAAQGAGGGTTWTGPTGAVYRVENGQIVGRVK